MKKLLTILLAALVLLGGFAGGRTALAEGPDFKTFGDIWDYESPASGGDETLYIRVFVADGVYYRAEAELTADQYRQWSEVDIFDPEADQKEKAVMADLPIRKLYDLSEALLPQEALDSLAGMTGQDLLDMGFVPSGSYGFGEEDWGDVSEADLPQEAVDALTSVIGQAQDMGLVPEGGEDFETLTTWAGLQKGPFEYQASFVEIVPAEDDPNVAEVIRPLTVKSVSFDGNVSDYATDRDFDINGGRTLEEYEAEYATFHEIEPVFHTIPEIPVEDSPFKTLADVFAVIRKPDDGEETPRFSSGMSGDMYVAAFDKDGAYYRVEAAIPADVAEQLDTIDFFDEKRDEKLEALLGPLPVTRVGDLSAVIPAQEELNALVGMTGEALLDLGFEYGMGYNFWEETNFYLTRDLVDYQVTFNEKVPEMEDYDDVLDELMRTMTVKKVQIDGLSSICSDPDLLW